MQHNIFISLLPSGRTEQPSINDVVVGLAIAHTRDGRTSQTEQLSVIVVAGAQSKHPTSIIDHDDQAL